ncbi:MAG: hypothetical protein L6Q54_12595 [Leptospiraceae bacterium]|nr:hypothetical protein [Leptospiraceae bacterium]MCK6382072.1 hypothetical protein [Leptospiraceae bacterium]
MTTKQTINKYQLNKDNIKDVLYATTRLLQGWKEPAWIDNEAYIDGAYTCGCPVKETIAAGFNKVIAISAEMGGFYSDLFGAIEITDTMEDATILKIQPDIDLGDIGVNFLTATDEGLEKAYDHGFQKGISFLESEQSMLF